MPEASEFLFLLFCCISLLLSRFFYQYKMFRIRIQRQISLDDIFSEIFLHLDPGEQNIIISAHQLLCRKAQCFCQNDCTPINFQEEYLEDKLKKTQNLDQQLLLIYLLITKKQFRKAFLKLTSIAKQNLSVL